MAVAAGREGPAFEEAVFFRGGNKKTGRIPEKVVV
jgi:hypothetical protein